MERVKKNLTFKTESLGDFNPTIFELDPPDRSLIVYPGEKRQLTCQISNVKDGVLQMEWLQNGVPVSLMKTASHRFQLSNTEDEKFRTVTVTISNVEWSDEGEWSCLEEWKDASLRKTIRLTPISTNVDKCVQVRVI